MWRWSVAACAAASLAALTGCATAPVHPPALRPAPGYVSRVDELNSVDASGLSGKRIALDPGHGGFFKGALGVHGLTEAEVNLGVALHLKALLESHGATVFLTRADDRDFTTPADSSLRSDLAERARLANAFHPDLFVSIHHNADARGAHDVNATQTYYKLGDDGPSLDAAADVHRYLVRNLGITEQRILPGNYFVLRNSDAPALLTESSYLTNPDVEAKLALDEKRNLEAEALFLGLARYFARRVPRIASFEATPFGGPPWIDGGNVAAEPRLTARIEGTFDDAALTVDGERVDAIVRGSEIEWSARAPLASGVHEAALAVRLAGEGTSRTQVLHMRVAGRPERVLAEFPGQAAWRGDEPLGLRVRVMGADGLVLRDTLRVRLASVGTFAVEPADTEVTVVDGAAWGYFRPAPRARLRAPRAPREARIRARIASDGAGNPAVAEATAHVALQPAAAAAVRSGFARAMPADTVLRGAPGTAGFAPALDWINRDGFVRLPVDAGGAVRVPALPGYRAWPTRDDAELAPRDTAAVDSFVPVPATAPTWPPRFAAIAGGALHGRRITLDPAGGGEDAAGMGPSGTRASSLNLEVARALAAFLRAAGADVALTRSGDVSMSDVERVQVSEAFHSDRFVRIGHAAEPPMLGYYFSSAGGRHMAESAAAAFTALGLAAPRLAEDAQYPLQQTSCAALYVSPARVDVAASEMALLAPGALRAEAYALFVGLAREWAPGAVWPADSLDVRDAAGQPVPGAAVTLGGALVVETDALGRARFVRTEPGAIEASVEDPRVRGRALLLESARGITLTGSSAGR
ncbi:MAG TPA: N-acetylmuramoyl-L-alanine amidase [Candidatus Saccharimonadaceae bacterium]|nr:N-acetylmuramoyl-L-alanine amidase [Candidatus Saccharimonadaceae bacterium]